MAPPVSEHGQPPDVTVLFVFKETNVISALRGSGEMVVNNVLRGSRGLNVNNVHRTTTEITVVMNLVYLTICQNL